MSNAFNIQVTATDKASAVFRKINDSMSKSFRPVQRVQKSLSAMGKELHLDKISKGLRGVSTSARTLASSLGLATPAMEGLFGLGAAGGIVATGAAIAALGVRFGNAGFEIGRTATAIGVSTDDLQKYRGAAKLAGLSAEDLTSSFEQLGTTLQDASAGRNAKAYIVLNKFGIGIKRNAAGLVDTVETYKELSRVISQIADPHVQKMIADTLGVGSSLSLLRKGPDVLEDLAEKTKKFGNVAGGDALAGAEKFKLSLEGLKGAIDGVANSWGSKLTPLLTRGAEQVTKTLTEGGADGALMDLLSGRLTRGFLSGGRDRSAQRSSGVVTGGTTDVPSAAGGRLPIGLRQHNPGNLRRPGNPVGFQTFDNDEQGLSAMAQQIGRYANRDGLRSISGILNKYAPGSENNTGAYIKRVSDDTGFDPNAQLNVNDPKVLAPLLSSMVKVEQGRQPFSADDYAKAAQTVKVEVAFANAPGGTKAKATTGGAAVPARVSYSMADAGAI